MTFEGIKNLVAEITDREDIDGLIGYWVNSLIRELERDPVSLIKSLIPGAKNPFEPGTSFKYMEKLDTSITASGSYLTAPSDYKDLIHLHVVAGGNRYRIDKRSADFCWRAYPSTSSVGIPALCAFIDSKFLVRPAPDSSTYTYECFYHKKSAELTSNSDTNWLTNNAPEILIGGAVLKATPYIGTAMLPQVQVWRDAFIRALHGLAVADIIEKYKGSGLYIQPGSDIV